MATKYALGRDKNSQPVFSLGFPNVNDPLAGVEASLSLAGGAKALTVPAGIYRLYFYYNAGATVYVLNNGTATVPTAVEFAASAQQINPPVRDVQPGDVVSCISEDPANVIVTFDKTRTGYENID